MRRRSVMGFGAVRASAGSVNTAQPASPPRSALDAPTVRPVRAKFPSIKTMREPGGGFPGGERRFQTLTQARPGRVEQGLGMFRRLLAGGRTSASVHH